MSSNDPNDGLSPEWDELLSDGLVEPPTDFQARVMHHVQNEQDVANALPSLTGSLTELLQTAAVTIAALAAGWQTLAFIFGLWATAVAV